MVLQCVHTHQVKCFISESAKVDEKFRSRDTHGTTGRFAPDCKPPFAPDITWKLPNTERSFRVTHHNTVRGVVKRCTWLSDFHFPFYYQNTETCNITKTDFCTFPGGSVHKGFTCSAGDPGSIHGLGRYPGEGNGYPLQYSCLENPTDRGAWRAAVHGVAESDMTERLTLSFVG